jgi:type II secretory pathway pseudopilin PulG
MLFKKGIMLIELLVIIALITMLSYLAISHYTLSSLYARTELQLLYQSCIYMQRRALIKKEPQTLRFDIAQQHYHFENRTHKLAAGVMFGVINGVKGPPATPTKLLTSPCTFKNNSITFYPDGIIDAGSIYITNKEHTQLYALTNAVSTYSYLRTYCYAGTWNSVE